MKSARLTISAVFALFVLLPPGFAQSAGFRVQVPFEFGLGNHNLAAGEYKVTVMKPGMLQLERLDGRGTAAVMTTYTGGGPNQDLRPRLIFHSYGDHYFLSQVWIDDVNVGHELFASASELRYARDGHQAQTTLLAKGQPSK
jgi:hypothetical protein